MYGKYNVKTASEFYRDAEKEVNQICHLQELASGKRVTWGTRINRIVEILAVTCENLDNECAVLKNELKIINEKVEDLKDYCCNIED